MRYGNRIVCLTRANHARAGIMRGGHSTLTKISYLGHRLPLRWCARMLASIPTGEFTYGFLKNYRVVSLASRLSMFPGISLVVHQVILKPLRTVDAPKLRYPAVIMWISPSWQQISVVSAFHLNVIGDVTIPACSIGNSTSAKP